MVMKAINIAELKTHLSRYLRLVKQGQRILVLDRGKQVAEIIPSRGDSQDQWETCATEGLLECGTQNFSSRRKIQKPKHPVDIQEHLRASREDR